MRIAVRKQMMLVSRRTRGQCYKYIRRHAETQKPPVTFRQRRFIYHASMLLSRPILPFRSGRHTGYVFIEDRVFLSHNGQGRADWVGAVDDDFVDTHESLPIFRRVDITAILLGRARQQISFDYCNVILSHPATKMIKHNMVMMLLARITNLSRRPAAACAYALTAGFYGFSLFRTLALSIGNFGICLR